ncbi:putative acetyltransferase [compost metagenome]
MKISPKAFVVNGMSYVIRSALPGDAAALSGVRVQIDGETEFMDRERGEGYIDPAGFEDLIRADTEEARNLFLVAEAGGRILGYCRCEGSALKRLFHRVEFGICILKEFWGYGIGRNLLQETVSWADAAGVEKIGLHVLETNTKAIRLYESFGFEQEGLLRRDKRLSDGQFYNTVVMGRLK